MSTSHDSSFDDFSYREYLDIRGHTKSYDGVIANASLEAVGFSAEPGATPRVKGGMMVSGNYFHVLGVEPRLGRGFRDDEDQVPGRDAVVVLGPDFWKHEFAERPVGRRQDGSPERHGLHRDWRGAGHVPGDADLRAIPTSTCRWRWRRCSRPTRRRHFFEDRDDRELSVKARLKAGHDAAAGAE